MMETTWTISIIEAGLVAIENGGFTRIASNAQNQERQLEYGGFSRAEILEVFLQLSASRKAVITIAPIPINIRPTNTAQAAMFSQIPIH